MNENDIEIQFAEADFVPVDPPRELSSWEIGVLGRLGAGEGHLVVVEECRCGCASVGFQLSPLELRRASHGYRHVARWDRLEAQGDAEDEDGMHIWTLFFVDEAGRPIELEVQRADGAPIRTLPDPHEIRIRGS